MKASTGGVLVIDDDPDIREMLVFSLEVHGCPASAVGDGAEALAWLESRSASPFLILLDLMMPKMNGAEFRQAQLRDSRLREIPVVILTGAGRSAIQSEVLEGLEVLFKPIDLQTILRTTQRYRQAAGA